MTGRPTRIAIGLAGVVALGAAGAAVAAPAGHTAGGATQQIAMLNQATPVFSKPRAGSRRTTVVRATRPITGSPTILPVIARTADPAGAAWVRVLLPGRPNGHSGWVPARSVTLALSSWRVSIRISARRVTVFRNGHSVRSFKAVVGLPATPTPLGRFFVEETVHLKPQDIGTPYALALSARSRVFQEFEGGPGQVAMHGTSNVGGVVGTAGSHGCIRLETSAITWLASHAGPGTPVTITN